MPPKRNMNILGKLQPQLIVFCIILLFFLNGCGDLLLDENINSTLSEENQIVKNLPSTDPLRGNILLWHSQSSSTQSLLDETIASYEKIHPQVTVIAEAINPEEFTFRFFKDFNRGLGPNLVLVDYFWTLDLIRANALLALTPKQINPNDLLPSALSQVTYQNQIYGFPVALLTQVLCYNKQKVKADNLPKTLDDLMSQAISGYSVGLPSSFVDTFWGLQIFGGKLFDLSGNIILKSGSWAAWLTWLQTAKNQPNIILDPDNTALEKAFIDNRLAYLVCDSTAIPKLREALGAESFAITQLPRGEVGKAGPLLYARILSIVNDSNTRHNQIALDFAQFITNSQQTRKRITQINSIISPDRRIKLNAKLFPIGAILMEQSKTAVAIPLQYIEQTYAIFTTAEGIYQEVIEGAIAPADAGVKLLELVQQNLNKKP
ncbi:MAG: ABC transporter substrate-binding protein [Microcystaceae cyanobacterium]